MQTKHFMQTKHGQQSLPVVGIPRLSFGHISIQHLQAIFS